MRATSRPSDQSMQPHPTDLSQACPSSPSPLQACPSSQFSCLTALSNPQPQVTSSQPCFLRALRLQDGRCRLAVQVMPSKLYIWRTHTQVCTHTWAAPPEREATDSLLAAVLWLLFLSAFEVYPFFPLLSRKQQLICTVFWKRVSGRSWVRRGTSLITFKEKGILKGKIRS